MNGITSALETERKVGRNKFVTNEGLKLTSEISIYKSLIKKRFILILEITYRIQN